MKKILISVLLLFFVVSMTTESYSKDGKKMPSAKVKTLKGETVNTSTFSNDGKPFVICFWATWCKPCLVEMAAMHDKYAEWQKQTGVKVYAISLDDSRSSKKVAPLVNGRGWKFDVLIDENSDFKRAMNVSNPPHSFLVNGAGEIVWEHNGYAPGDENELLNQIRKLTSN